jgi:hypothetical protein
MDLKALQDLPPWEWPDDTPALLQRSLTDNRASADDRLLAVQLAGETEMSDALADALLAVISDAGAAEALRATAAIALSPVLEEADVDDFDDPDTVLISERTFIAIADTLHTVHEDADAPMEVRRRALEAAVRAPQAWQQAAIRAALGQQNELWQLTAVFCMRFVQGFDAEIIAALASEHPQIRCEAVLAAGAWQLEGAFDQVAALIRSQTPDKALLLAAIEAAPSIRPEEAPELLEGLLDATDPDIALAAEEALAMAEATGTEPADDDMDFDDDDEDDEDEDEDLE